MWTTTSIGVSASAPRQLTPADVSAQASASTQKPLARAAPSSFCSAFNSTAGCSKKQRDCPHGGKHACSQALPD
eukprot:977738-Amphidinium_carterae.1